MRFDLDDIPTSIDTYPHHSTPLDGACGDARFEVRSWAREAAAV